MGGRCTPGPAGVSSTHAQIDAGTSALTQSQTPGPVCIHPVYEQAQVTVKELIYKLWLVRDYHDAKITGYSQNIMRVIAKLEGELELLQNQAMDTETAGTILTFARSISGNLDEPVNPLAIAVGLDGLARERRWGLPARIRRSQAGLYFGHMNANWVSPDEIAKLEKARRDIKLQGPKLVAKLNAAANGLDLKNRAGDAAKVRKLAADWEKKLAALATEKVATGTTASNMADFVGGAGNVITAQPVVGYHWIDNLDIDVEKLKKAAGSDSKIAYRLKQYEISKSRSKFAGRASLIITVATGTVAIVDALAHGDGVAALKSLGTTGAQIGLSLAGPFGAVILVGWAAVDIIMAVAGSESVKVAGAASAIHVRWGAKIAVEWLDYMEYGGPGGDKLRGEPRQYLYKEKKGLYHQWKVYNPAWPEPRARWIQTVEKNDQLASKFAQTNPDTWESSGLYNEAFRNAE